MPLKTHLATLNRAWTYIKSNYLKPNVENLVPRNLWKTPRIITSLDQSTHLPKVDLTNPRVQAALINAKGVIFASHAVLLSAIFGTIGLVATVHDKSKKHKIKAQKEEIITQKSIIDAQKKTITNQKSTIAEEKSTIVEEKSTIVEQSDIIVRQQKVLKELELFQSQIRKCKQSTWCSFFLKQTEIQSPSKSTKQPKKETISHHRKS